ncbi:MAG: hypothetical protein D6801_06135 [Alphaproteobacteria bacterium]|nr:MAG: hypothetical protein D6801_06135 [Alphaproteobacteria bacterium]
MRVLPISRTVALAAGLVALASAALADNMDRRVRVVNETGFTLTRFYGSHRNAATWEADLFGEAVLPTGDSVIVNFDDGTGYCVFDLRAEFEDGDVIEKFDVNICEIGTLTYK